MTERGPAGAERPAAPVIREADTEDLAAIAAVFLACWRTSYDGILPGRVLELYDEEGSRALWRRLLPSGTAGGTVLVAERPSGETLAVIRLGRDPERAARGHVYSLYVHPSGQGSGVGRALLTAAEARFRAQGLREASLWVFAANAAARAFYARLGWHPDGGTRVEAAYGEPELRLVRRIPGADAGTP